MRSFKLEIKEDRFTSMPRIVSRYICGYKTAKGIRYMVNVNGIYGGVFTSFKEADLKRKDILKFLGD